MLFTVRGSHGVDIIQRFCERDARYPAQSSYQSVIS